MAVFEEFQRQADNSVFYEQTFFVSFSRHLFNSFLNTRLFEFLVATPVDTLHHATAPPVSITRL